MRNERYMKQDVYVRSPSVTCRYCCSRIPSLFLKGNWVHGTAGATTSYCIKDRPMLLAVPAPRPICRAPARLTSFEMLPLSPSPPPARAPLLHVYIYWSLTCGIVFPCCAFTLGSLSRGIFEDFPQYLEASQLTREEDAALAVGRAHDARHAPTWNRRHP